MGAARSILEKSTMMLLTTSKVRLHHKSSCLSQAGQQDGEILGSRSSCMLLHLVPFPPWPKAKMFSCRPLPILSGLKVISMICFLFCTIEIRSSMLISLDTVIYSFMTTVRLFAGFSWKFEVDGECFVLVSTEHFPTSQITKQKMGFLLWF